MSTHTADRAPMLRLGPTRAIARRASAVRAAIALAVALFGFVQVIAVENGAAGTIVGAGLVALAAPLARGRRRALLAATGLVLASLALDDDAIARPGLAALGLLTAFVVCAPAFRASGDPATRRLIVPAAALLAIGLDGRPRARRWASHASPGCDAAGGRLPAGGPGAAPVAQRRDG